MKIQLKEVKSHVCTVHAHFVYVTLYASYLSHTHTPTHAHTQTSSGLKLFDLTKDGVEEIIVGRDDGRLDIYGQDTGMNKKTSLLFSKDIGKSRDKSVDMYLQPPCIVET